MRTYSLFDVRLGVHAPYVKVGCLSFAPKLDAVIKYLAALDSNEVDALIGWLLHAC